MFWNSVQGCSLKIGEATLSNGEVTIGAVQGVHDQFTIDLKQSANTTTVTTNLPADPNTAYSVFIAAKKDAMINGGTVTQAATDVYSFSGYKNQSKEWLMSLNGLKGPAINLLPSLGVTWHTAPSGTGLSTICVRSAPCDNGYGKIQDLFAMEMVLYHALNEVSWRLLRDSTGGYLRGSWQLYQGIIAAWTAVAARSQYLYNVATLGAGLGISIGWVNPNCGIKSFVVFADVFLNREISGEDLGYFYDLYMQNAGGLCNKQTLWSDHPQDSNTVIESYDGGPIFFIADLSKKRVYTNALCTATSPVFWTALGGFGQTGITTGSDDEQIVNTRRPSYMIAGQNGMVQCTNSGCFSGYSWLNSWFNKNNNQYTPVTPSQTTEGEGETTTVSNDIVPVDFEPIADMHQYIRYGTGSSGRYRVGLVCYGVQPDNGFANRFAMMLPDVINGYNIVTDEVDENGNPKRNYYEVSVEWRVKDGMSPAYEPDNIDRTRMDLGNFSTIPVTITPVNG